MARHQASGTEHTPPETIRANGPRDSVSPRRDALAAPPEDPQAPRHRAGRPKFDLARLFSRR
jgi:hypothetical protein